MPTTNTVENYIQIITQDVPILDVRAETEFNDGAIPGSVNIPILNDEERRVVGICYKQNGKEAALDLGLKIVCGENKNEKLERWKQFFKKYPHAYLTCYRGGLRSQITQQWLAENNIVVPRLLNGYKGFRAWAIQQIDIESQNAKVKVVSGTTGSGKTHFLRQCPQKIHIIDLEKQANHRGSAFGSLGLQPSQADFEHRVLKEFLTVSARAGKTDQSILIEDESRLIGQRALPLGVFNMIRSSSILLLEEPLESRVEHIFDNYVNSPIEPHEVTLGRYIQSTASISKKLGIERTKEIINDIQACRVLIPGCVSPAGQTEFKFENFKWIEKLLVWYYDPMYLGSLQKRNPRIEFRGTRVQLKDYLRC